MPAAVSSPYPSVSNLAFAIDSAPQFHPQQTAQVKADAAHLAKQLPVEPARVEDETQPWLFRASDVVGRPRVVPIPILTPRVEPGRKARGNRSPRRRVTTPGLQHLLDLQETAEPAPKGFDTVIDCDAAVAPAGLRVEPA